MKYAARSLTPSLATLPQDVPLCSPRHLLVSIPFPVLSTCKSTACALLNSLASLFATPFLCFQLLADSFAKRGGGWGVPSLSRHSPLVAPTNRKADPFRQGRNLRSHRSHEARAGSVP